MSLCRKTRHIPLYIVGISETYMRVIRKARWPVGGTVNVPGIHNSSSYEPDSTRGQLNAQVGSSAYLPTGVSLYRITMIIPNPPWNSPVTAGSAKDDPASRGLKEALLGYDAFLDI